MSIAAARSPSPGPPARPCCGLRRSADSSPFRPAASPPDSPQRSSSAWKNSGRISPRPWGAEKENDPRERDAAASARTHKVRSSGGGCGGVCVAKSFMAPTISAASKAVAPSATPRKKILGERNNDPVPSSPLDLAHSSKPRGSYPPPPEEQALGAARRLRLSLDGAPAPPPPPAAGPVVSRGARRSCEAEEAAVVVEDPVSRSDHHAAAAAADAEAVAAPYDPKTNYLSPRPRYLHFQPNRRLEIYRHDGGAVRGLEDMFASESSSATTTTEEEEVSGEGQPVDSSEEETSALASPSEARAQSAAPALDDLLRQPALDSPPARVLTPEGKEESPRAGGVLIPEQEPAASPARARPKKKRSSMRFLLAPLALVLLMAAAFVCVPPPPGHPVMLNTSLSKVSDFLSVQELHPVELAARLKQWSSSSLDFVMSYWEAIASYQGRDVYGPHLPANLSAAAADVDADYAFGFYFSAAQTSPISLEKELGIQEVVSESDTEMIAGPDVEELATYYDPDADSIDDTEMEQEDVSGVPSATEVNVDAAVEVLNAEMAEEVSGSSGEEMAASIQNSDIPSQTTPEPEQPEGIDEASLQQDVQTEGSGGDHDGKEDQEAHHGQKLGSDMWPSYLDKISDPAVIGAALAGIIVAAAVAFLYMRQKQTRVASNEPAEQVVQAEQVEQIEQVEQVEQVEQAESLSGSGSSQGHVVAKGSLFHSADIEETERLGGSGPSQYSSSLSSGLGRRTTTKGEDASGPEPVVSSGLGRRTTTKGEDASGPEPVVSRTRRDSTAQSTSSYGSFTTYQKIPAKKGNKEDEAMTPVRRSSRLRNVKTPEA